MKKRTVGDPMHLQKIKNLNLKLLVNIISVTLIISIIGIACLGIGLSVSNSNIAKLQIDLNGKNEALKVLDASNKASDSEIDSLRSILESANEKLDNLTSELAALKDALKLSEEEQDLLENNLDAIEKSNQSAKNEIDQLKSDIENAKKEISALKERQNTPEDKIRIYIDQGHNPAPYHNSGSTGNGLFEHDITFLIGCLLAEILRSDERFDVQLSRPNKSVVLGTDTKSSLMARVEGAAEFDADYLVSLHTNFFDQETVTGIEVYVADESGEAYVFGESLLKGLVDSTNLKNRGMKLNQDFDVLEYSSMPAVLLEMGFISNSSDAALFSEHPELFAQGIYNGILDYFGLLNNTLVSQ